MKGVPQKLVFVFPFETVSHAVAQVSMKLTMLREALNSILLQASGTGKEGMSHYTRQKDI